MGRFDWLNLKRLLRDRDQLTAELAEQGVAPEDEKQWTEERVEREVEHRGDHTPPTATPDEPPSDD